MQVESILKVPAIVLANLCVAYIMTSQVSAPQRLGLPPARPALPHFSLTVCIT